MPSAANAKAEKPASTEAADNTPVRQVMTIIEHKIRNLEKRKSKLTSYRDLQKAGKELNSDQKIAVAKYDEVVQTLEFARDFSKQICAIAVVAEREAKKQAKKEAWVRNFSETNKIREVLLILDCLVQMGTPEARDDFLNGTNGAAKLTEDDLKVLDDLYPEVTPKHELNEEGQPGFHANTIKAAEHLYAIIDGKPKDVLGTTYAHIKEIVTAVHGCGYFDREPASEVPVEEFQEQLVLEPPVDAPVPIPGAPYPPPAGALPVPPAPTVVPAPGYPLRPIPPITLQEVEHAYFAQQYPQQRPISEVIGSQNFYFLQESEIDSPIATPQPPVMGQPSPPPPIPTQTFTNQHFPGAVLPPPHFHEHAAYPPVAPAAIPIPHPQVTPAQPPAPAPVLIEPTPPATRPETEATPPSNDNRDESRDEDREEGERKQGQGDGQNRFRRFGGRGGGPRPSNGYRGRPFQPRQNSGGRDYQNRTKDRDYSRNYDGGYNKYNNKDNFRDNYYGNGDAGEERHHENGRDRHNDSQSYGGGFKGRGRGGGTRPPRDNRDSRPPRVNRPQQYSRSKPDNAE